MSHLPWTRDGLTTIPEVLKRASQRWPDRQAFDIGGETQTYAELIDDATRLAHGLSGLGIGKGDTVCTMLDTSLDALWLLYAISMIGAVSVPINTSYKGEFLRHQIADSEASVLIAETLYAERILAMTDVLPSARLLLFRGAAPSVTTEIAIRPLDEVRSKSTTEIPVDVDPGDLALILYTSGTTGPAKGCMLPHSYLCNMAMQVADGLELTERDVYWTPLPLYHTNAITSAGIAAPMSGAAIALYPRFSLSNFWPELERTGATVASILGSMISLTANAPENEVMKRYFGKLRAVIGAPFTDELKRIWKERFGVRLAGAPGYGLTEMCMITYAPLRAELPGKVSGRRFKDYDVRILDDRGNECPPGVPGEIVARPCRPGIMFQGYWRRPEETLAAWSDLWFHTGDIGAIDADGLFTFVDRKKDYLRRSGENISSFEMENTFLAHPAIKEIAVHAVPSSLLEDEVKITAVLLPGSSLSEEELCRWSIDRVPYFAIPRYIEFRSELPRSPVGRILKYQLRSEGVTPATWDRAISDIEIVKR